MPINNGIGFTSYRRTMGRNPEGSPADTSPHHDSPYVNPLPSNVWTVTVGGTATAGDYAITVTEPDGTEHVVDMTRAAETNAQIATALRSAAEFPASALGVFTIGGSGLDVVITSDHEGIELEVAVSAPAPGTLTAVETTTVEGVEIPFGRFVVNGGASSGGDGLSLVELPDGATAAQLVGVTLRPHLEVANANSPLASAEDAYPPGKLVSVRREGSIEMLNVGGDAAADGLVYCVVNTAGGNELGQARGTADGGNTVALGAQVARWLEATPSGQRGPVHVRF